MIKVCVEVREEHARFRVAVRAESIVRAISLLQMRHPGGDVRVVFPIDPEGFFVPKEDGVGQVESGGLRPLQDPVVRV